MVVTVKAVTPRRSHMKSRDMGNSFVLPICSHFQNDS
jgi:hypothetical protein